MAVHHMRNNALRASSPALRTTDDDRATVPAPDLPFAATGPPAALALFAAAAARKRFAPLGRLTRAIVPLPLLGIFSISISISIPNALPTPPRSRSPRRRNGLGRFSSSCRLYVGSCLESLEETVRVLPDEDEDDVDEEDPALVVVIVASSGCAVSAASASTRFTWDWEDMDGRRRRLVR